VLKEERRSREEKGWRHKEEEEAKEEAGCSDLNLRCSIYIICV
jgi:hypothetical protein